MATFWARLGKFGLLFILPSGHTGCVYKVNNYDMEK